MKPKSRKEILDICQNNFWNYSTLSKIMIIISVALSSATLVYFICGYIIPTIQGIANNEIVGWGIMWKLFFGYILYYMLKLLNYIFVSIGGSALCREENWDTLDFAKAWVDIYEYEERVGKIFDDDCDENPEE